MKKLIAALAAAAMLCCTMISPVSAEETYRKGDVNMDGTVNIADSQLALMEYALLVLGGYDEGILSEEQRELARVVSPEILEEQKDEGDSAFLTHAQAILMYYCYSTLLSDPSVEKIEVGTWFTQWRTQYVQSNDL